MRHILGASYFASPLLAPSWQKGKVTEKHVCIRWTASRLLFKTKIIAQTIVKAEWQQLHRVRADGVPQSQNM